MSVVLSGGLPMRVAVRSAVVAVLTVVAVRGGSAQDATGRIEGTATITSRLATQRLRVRVYDEPGTPPPSRPADSSPFANVVLYLESAPTLRGHGRPPANAALRQHNEQFTPHILPIVVGTTVDFPNDDPIYHNVFSLSQARTFDLGRYPRGRSKLIRFDTPGIVQVFCHIHADMSGYILVLEHPFFVVPDSLGRYALEGVPAGDYRLVAWHERIRPIVVPVHVTAGRTTSLDVSLPVPRPATP